MKRVLALSIMLALGGCATVAPPATHHTHPAPTVTVVPSAPVPPATFKMRWRDRISANVRAHFFHHKH